jgi:hypothetical protein
MVITGMACMALAASLTHPIARMMRFLMQQMKRAQQPPRPAKK